LSPVELNAPLSQPSFHNPDSVVSHSAAAAVKFYPTNLMMLQKSYS
jgi:hypothetical protein